MTKKAIRKRVEKLIPEILENYITSDEKVEELNSILRNEFSEQAFSEELASLSTGYALTPKEVSIAAIFYIIGSKLSDIKASSVIESRRKGGASNTWGKYEHMIIWFIKKYENGDYKNKGKVIEDIMSVIGDQGPNLGERTFNSFLNKYRNNQPLFLANTEKLKEKAEEMRRTVHKQK